MDYLSLNADWASQKAKKKNEEFEREFSSYSFIAKQIIREVELGKDYTYVNFIGKETRQTLEDKGFKIEWAGSELGNYKISW